jgi:Tfp pilus assembly protein FimT
VHFCDKKTVCPSGGRNITGKALDVMIRGSFVEEALNDARVHACASKRAPSPASAVGFTIIEMVITLGVAAIFASMAMPSFVDMVRANRMQSAADLLQSDFLVARREAIKRNAKVLVCPARANPGPSDDLCIQDKGKWADGWVVCYDAAGAAPACSSTSADNPNPVLRRGKLDSHLYIDQAISHKYISFEANGKSSNDSATVTNRNPASKMKLGGNWSDSASYFACIQGSGVIAVRKKTATDTSDPC